MMNEQVIFTAALERQPNERSDFLDSACGADEELRQRVELLLRLHDEARSFLESPAAELSPTLDQPSFEKPGTQIGLYKLLQQIGEGGMGVVYMAEQTEPIERRVALKIIKPGMDTRQVVARFEAERQALAMMDHPNIAKVLDAGATDNGRPYFVMELVRGVPITEYCDQHKLTPRQRLELFLPVCQAIQHAHQKGIIHRDIKPSNVLVAHYDDKPVSKVIDFGVAKAINHRLTEKTMFTQFGQVLGTLEYMSPEQARLNQWDVDTRSDVYSLGVLLYELLSGETPFDRERFRSAAFDELLTIIREEDPPRPSIRLSSSESLPTIAANRQTEPRHLSALVRGELDWIVMKSLDKDRTRRYQTASKFADDVQHYLNGDAVEACPPSGIYKFRKFVRRNLAAFVTIGLVAAALVVGAGVATWQAISANQETERAERELMRATEVKSLIKQMLRNVRPSDALGEDTTLLRRILNETAERLEQGEVADELVAAELHEIIGEVFFQLGLYAQSVEHVSAALKVYRDRYGDQNEETVELITNLGHAHMQWGHFEHGEVLLKESIAINNSARGERHRLTLVSKLDLASAYAARGNHDDAGKLLDEILPVMIDVLGEDHEATLVCMMTLGTVKMHLGQLQDAETLIRRMLDVSKPPVFPAGHPIRLQAMNNLAIVLQQLARERDVAGDGSDVLELREDVLVQIANLLPPDHPHVLTAKINLANSYKDLGVATADPEMLALAKTKLEEVLSVAEQDPANASLWSRLLANARINLGTIHVHEEDYGKADEQYEKLMKDIRIAMPDDTAELFGQQCDVAFNYLKRGEYSRAVKWYEQALDETEDKSGIDDETKLSAICNLGCAYSELGKNHKACKTLELCLPGMRSMQHRYTSICLRELADVYGKLDQSDNAVAKYRELLDLTDEKQSVTPADLNAAACVCLKYGHDYQELYDPQRALRLAQRACALTRVEGPSLWIYRDTLALARFETGDFAGAYADQLEALKLMPSDASSKQREEARVQLEKYESAIKKEVPNDGAAARESQLDTVSIETSAPNE